MRLLNFSIGQVQTVQIGGDVVRTGHIKAPVAEPWRINEDGAEGDQRAAHPDKIYAFARTGYTHWGEYLKVDPKRWPDGFFGENLTLDDLDETDVRVGDVFALGDEVRLFVAGARNPCIKLAWRFSQPRTFQKIFAKSRRTGVYLGVLTPGVVRSGDVMKRIHHDPGMPSVADVCDYVSDHNPPPLEPLKRLLAFESFSSTNRLLLSSKLDAAQRAASAIEGRWAGWRPFTVAKIVEETPEIRSVHLRPVDGEPLCQPRAGQFVTVRMDDGGDAVTRSWSISEFRHGMDDYRLSVKRQSGPGSHWVHRAEVGDLVKLRAPAGEFTLDMGGFRPVVLIAAGIGITPLIAMLHAHLARPQSSPIFLLYGARTPEEAAFLGELEALAAAHRSVTTHFIYSRSAAGHGSPSRITPDLAISLLSDLHIFVGERRVDLPWYETDMYLCGPDDFCQRLRNEFVGLGANADNVFVELFTAPEMASSEIETAEVRFARSGTSLAWTAHDDLSLLDLAAAAGVAVESDCRAGSCLTCRTKVLDGAVTAELGDGTALLCIGKPTTSLLVLDC
jgi:ferredoxin-NADP reductase/MOSC domain-containing protein YiiM